MSHLEGVTDLIEREIMGRQGLQINLAFRRQPDGFGIILRQ